MQQIRRKHIPPGKSPENHSKVPAFGRGYVSSQEGTPVDFKMFRLQNQTNAEAKPTFCEPANLSVSDQTPVFHGTSSEFWNCNPQLFDSQKPIAWWRMMEDDGGWWWWWWWWWWLMMSDNGWWWLHGWWWLMMADDDDYDDGLSWMYLSHLIW